MSTNLQLIKTQFKKNIELLINNERLDEAEISLNEYLKIAPDDIEVYSIKAVLLIMKQNFEEAERILKKGLAYDRTNFDLNYNLAYIYEASGLYNESIIYYNKAKNAKYYDTKTKIQIDNILSNIYENNSEAMESECCNSEIYLHLKKIKNIMFVANDLTSRVNNLANKLDDCSINIDLAYIGRRPESLYLGQELAFRKSLGITNLDRLIEYIDYYSYDIVHLFNMPDNIEQYIMHKCKSRVIVNNDILNQDAINVLRFYSKGKNIKNPDTINIPDKNVTIIIPTYNRPKYLQRVLDYFNNFKLIKPFIIVLDSSFEDNKLLNQTSINALSNNRFSYFNFESSINFFSKLNFGIDKVKTDYVALCADDDFLTEEGILESINKLENNKELYSVKGKNLYFTDTMAKLKEYDFFKGLYSDTAFTRLQEITKGFVPSLIYQVFRVNKFKFLYSFFEKHADKLPENATFQEYLFYFMVICTGKLGTINVDLNIRDKSVPRETEIKNFPHAVMDNSFNDNYSKFCLFLSKYLDTIGENNRQFNEYSSEIFSNFLINFLNVPKEYVIIENESFNLKQLEIGMRKSWVWPNTL